MIRKVEKISKEIADKLSSIPSVDCVLLQGSAEKEMSNPYFFISLDVYYRGALPEAEERQRIVGDVGAFESSFFSQKDRFFIDNIPVRVEYKHKDRVDHIIQNKEGNIWAFRDTGTYMFYRLKYGRIILNKTSWINGVQAKLDDFSDTFWKALRDSALMTMEHHVIDISSAVIEHDDLFYITSLSGYIKALCSFLFAVNRQFEPSKRNIADKILKLEKLPENFAGRFDSLIREDEDFSRVKRQEVAKLLTKSLLYLV